MGFQALIRPLGLVGSVLPPFGGNQVQNFQRGLLVGEVASVADGLAEPGVQALDGVGGVHDGAQLDGVVEEGHELSPGLFPGVDHRRVAIAPGLGELGGLQDLAHQRRRQPVVAGELDTLAAGPLDQLGRQSRIAGSSPTDDPLQPATLGRGPSDHARLHTPSDSPAAATMGVVATPCRYGPPHLRVLLLAERELAHGTRFRGVGGQ
jgi:hypothetical protein